MGYTTIEEIEAFMKKEEIDKQERIMNMKIGSIEGVGKIEQGFGMPPLPVMEIVRVPTGWIYIVDDNSFYAPAMVMENKTD